ncbi:MAG: hypothetical protein CMF36_05920 [Leeuwenhoekiella sp.]|nr:hypothetical protein [Leeuwenhoekiella sp.]MBA80652.1 hypothetical protein [Leeuwenhoekiella sp.]
MESFQKAHFYQLKKNFFLDRIFSHFVKSLQTKKAPQFLEELFAVWTGLEPCLASPVAVALLPNIFIYVDDL